MEPVKIGKFTLESLTTGMYSDSRIIYREYIQNSTDAIDAAIKANIITQEEARIDIIIDEKKKRISIKDNGIGISYDNVWHTLGDIGNSAKSAEENRGFRGIGRLGGLSYANELQFITSVKGQDVRTIYLWDSKKLRELLQPGKYMDYDLTKVMNEISCIVKEKEDKDKHYFQVILDGIDEQYAELLNVENIRDYLSQVAPVPFDAQRFPYYFDDKEGILAEINRINKPVEEYNIYLNGDPNPIYKPYKTWFTADRKHKKKDDITGIEFFKSYKDDNELLFWGWYARTNWLGAIIDDNIKGLRVRKKNILIGDGNTLHSNDFYTQERYNSWVVGEVHVYDESIIPNARRDYFEKNETYEFFRKRLKQITREVLSKFPGKYSNARTEKKNLEEAEKVIPEITKKLENGLTSELQREELYEKLDSVKEKIKPNEVNKKYKSSTKNTNKKKAIDIDKGDKGELSTSDFIENKKKSVFSKLQNLENQIIDSDVYRTKDIPSSYPKCCRKVVSIIFEEIDSTLQESEAENLIENIIERLRVKPKSNKRNG